MPRHERSYLAACELLTSEEIVLLLAIDPTWHLPHGTPFAWQRMKRARQLIGQIARREYRAGMNGTERDKACAVRRGSKGPR